MNRMILGLALLAAIGLGGCDKLMPQKQGPAPYNNGGNGWPGADGSNPWQQSQNQGPQGPYPPGPQGPYPPGPQGPYPPGADGGGYPQGPQGPYPQGPQGPQGYPQGPQGLQGYPQGPQQGPQGYPQGPQGPTGAPLQVSGPPPGMAPLQSQAGYVFTTQLSGSPQASKLVQAVLQGTQGYFDGPPRIVGQQTDPSERMAVVYFNSTLKGQPVSGMVGVQGDGQNNGIAYLLFDSSDRVQQTMPMMMAATQRRPPGG